MSIILKGIDMPKEKDEALLLLILGDGTVAEKIGSDRYEEMTETQAIQIPKGHGRLIDGDKLNKRVHEWNPAYTYGRSAFTREIENATTILEEEK